MSFAGRKPNSFGDVSVRVTGRRNSQRRSIEVCVQKRWEVDGGQREERKILEFLNTMPRAEKQVHAVALRLQAAAGNPGW